MMDECKYAWGTRGTQNMSFARVRNSKRGVGMAVNCVICFSFSGRIVLACSMEAVLAM